MALHPSDFRFAAGNGSQVSPALAQKPASMKTSVDRLIAGIKVA